MVTKGVAVVTGASRGIGKAVATRLGEMGYRLALISNEESRLVEIGKKNFESGILGRIFCLDVRDLEHVKTAVLSIENSIGPIDILVNCAGIAHYGGLMSCTEEEWHETLSINLDGYFHMLKAVLPGMRARRAGTVINMSSIWGKQGSPTMAAYSASKFAIEGMTAGLTQEVQPFGIKVSSIVLDKVDTDFRDNMKQHVQFSEEKRALMLSADDVADAVEYLVRSSPRCLPESITLKAWRF